MDQDTIDRMQCDLEAKERTIEALIAEAERLRNALLVYFEYETGRSDSSCNLAAALSDTTRRRMQSAIRDLLVREAPRGLSRRDILDRLTQYTEEPIKPKAITNALYRLTRKGEIDKIEHPSDYGFLFVASLQLRHTNKESIMASNPRDTYKYQFKEGNKVVHGGITKDLDRRESEHQQKWPSGHIKQVGRRTTEEAARKWEKGKGY